LPHPKITVKSTSFPHYDNSHTNTLGTSDWVTYSQTDYILINKKTLKVNGLSLTEGLTVIQSIIWQCQN